MNPVIITCSICHKTAILAKFSLWPWLLYKLRLHRPPYKCANCLGTGVYGSRPEDWGPKRDAYHAEQKRLFEEHKIAMYVPDDRRPNQ